jgi:ABC-type nitrate/sulfonate/bicarbonate transport system ATPase subunit
MHIKGLNFSYNGFTIFKDFTFECDSSLILLMGPSGCGKTTFLKIISKSLYDGVSYQIFDAPEKSYLVLQDDALCPWLTGLHNIVNFVNIDAENLSKIPLFNHIESFIYKKACNMSFGQRRMIELLRAVAFKPKLLLLDEPFNYMDIESRRIISDELLNLINSKQTKIVLSSHYNEDFNLLKPQVFYFPDSKPISKLNNERIY